MICDRDDDRETCDERATRTITDVSTSLEQLSIVSPTTNSPHPVVSPVFRRRKRRHPCPSSTTPSNITASLLVIRRNRTVANRSGQHPENPQHLLQGQGVPQAHPAQGHAVQGRQGFPLRPGKASLRSQAERLWWSDQARLPQEG